MAFKFIILALMVSYGKLNQKKKKIIIIIIIKKININLFSILKNKYESYVCYLDLHQNFIRFKCYVRGG